MQAVLTDAEAATTSLTFDAEAGVDYFVTRTEEVTGVVFSVTNQETAEAVTSQYGEKIVKAPKYSPPVIFY